MLITMLITFLLDFGATYAGTRAIIEINKKRPVHTAHWGLMVNLFGGTALLLVVWQQNIPAFLSGCAGAWVADYLAVRREAHAEKSGHTST